MGYLLSSPIRYPRHPWVRPGAFAPSNQKSSDVPRYSNGTEELRHSIMRSDRGTLDARGMNFSPWDNIGDVSSGQLLPAYPSVGIKRKNGSVASTACGHSGTKRSRSQATSKAVAGVIVWRLNEPRPSTLTAPAEARSKKRACLVCRWWHRAVRHQRFVKRRS